ncbi:uncharacterized protein CC84DRAFT_1183010 [Paraphaeosphaeria sporulosa]|uniref:DH domain-containing protein n=1 Tax=Paraphaeosphaeria sporulosa TaxID=1460663 RepID=A0A177CXP1_9PLEO|nr:uncharacterized protein CC84DRAFT_1183010 [Paraphaeosphaeria sporulosa]OAG12303.1 hypothetical protein CC84DRAFT_1183010 [Paraphaeosphaeria sporulosa]
MEVAFHSGLARAHSSQSANPAAHARIASSSGPSLMSHQSYQSQHSSYSHSTHRDTQSTAATSTSTLFTTPPTFPGTPVNGGPVEAADNVLNKRADKESSLFHSGLQLQLRLRAIPGFERWISEEENKADDDADPVTLLWRTFRRGFPLMDIYNALGPKVRLAVDTSKMTESTTKKFEKMAAYKFLQACIGELKFPPEECFMIGDLYGDDTTGFVKVVKVVNRVLDILVQMGIIQNTEAADGAGDPTRKKTRREHIINELVSSERTYVQHLEMLQMFKRLVEEKGSVTGDAIHDIFLNLNALLDFQRRFLIRVEQTNAQPPHEQNWGNLFVLYKDAFKVYEPYVANQKKSEQVAVRDYEKLVETGGSGEMQQMVQTKATLPSFLIKPFQRLTKYPLLLKDLRANGELEEHLRDDISNGIDATEAVLERINAAIAREDRMEAVEELKTLVEDWKGHRIEGFGDLLLYGQYTVLKGDGMNGKQDEREYKIYLFEMILLCCKELSANKAKKMNKALTTKTGKPRLQLKGRIFMQNVTETISLQKPGSYTCQIFWKGDPGIENFIIRFNTEDTMKKWATQVDTQRRVWKDHARNSASTTHSKPSDTQFTYMHDQNLVNPYAEDDDDEDEDIDTVVPGYPPTSSSASIRSRSTTGESANDATVPPPRFPMGYPQAPLTLRTQQLANFNQDGSYFSPVDTPMSTYSNARTSSSSAGTFPFPRQTPPSGYHEENNRYTAPARGHVTRETSMGPGMLPGRTVSRPSLPPTSNSASMSAGRMRAASSPDIHNALRPGRQPNGQQPSVPEMPPFPTHYAYNAAIVNRSQNNSPNSMPPRAATGSPAIQRDRLVQQRTAEQLANTHPDLPLHYGGPARRDPSSVPSARTMTPHSSFERSQGTLTPASMDSRTMSPPLSQASTLNENHSGIPTQLKVKVHCPAAGSTMTLVVSTNISFQSLKDRIDAKLQRSTSVSLGSGQVKLKYLDDDTFVTISTDDDLQEAFETWKEQQRDLNPGGQQLGEIELFCQ